MPRSSSFRSSSTKSSSLSSKPRSSSYSNTSSAPTTSSVAAPASPMVQHHSVKVEQPGFFSNMVQGFGLGAGQSLAFNLFRSNPTPAPAVPASAPIPTSTASATTLAQTPSFDASLPKEYVRCMKETNNDTDGCKHYLN